MSGSGRRTPPTSARGGAPSGRPDAATFRRRRLTVGLLALVLVAGLVIGGRALWGIVGGDRAGSADAGGSTPATPTGPTEEELANPVACAAGALEVSIDLTGDTLRHGAGSDFPITVTNSGQVPCLVDLGYAGFELALFSGGDRVWTTADCHGERPEHQEYLFDLGYSQTTTIPWQGRRSAPDCAKDQNFADAGTYRARVTLHPVSRGEDVGPATPITQTRVFGLE
ncbi:hypothetical protein GCG21_10635 [Pseudactinotalea sp. HY160]|uniref:hypothetical protein n=1 Tax=Pseudactinotalea sp. HY160 TaxID=2654490 RepID=UPI00128AEFE8|nr:hypothetical protein [Pseudactinotalea sp. HY160]MPV50450.1 hypothetical protein [Pseudactinotalea sp. HY160]